MKASDGIHSEKATPSGKADQAVREAKLIAPVATVPPEISMRGFVKELRRLDLLPMSQSFVFVLGAGASISSGIPGAQKLADTWLAEMHELDPKYNAIPFHQWMHDGRHGINDLDPRTPLPVTARSLIVASLPTSARASRL